MLDYLVTFHPQMPQISQEDFVLKLRFCARGLAGMYHDWYSGITPMTLEELSQKAEHLLQVIIADR